MKAALKWPRHWKGLRHTDCPQTQNRALRAIHSEFSSLRQSEAPVSASLGQTNSKLSSQLTLEEKRTLKTDCTFKVISQTQVFFFYIYIYNSQLGCWNLSRRNTSFSYRETTSTNGEDETHKKICSPFHIRLYWLPQLLPVGPISGSAGLRWLITVVDLVSLESQTTGHYVREFLDWVKRHGTAHHPCVQHHSMARASDRMNWKGKWRPTVRSSPAFSTVLDCTQTNLPA